MGLIDLGLIDGNAFGAAHVDLIEAAINVGQPAGEVRLSVAAVAPAGWLFLSGQVVINFQGLYPQTWAVIPAAWKSGSNANLPNMEQRFPVGAHASFPLGTAGGSLTKTIAAANLPVHSHTFAGTTGDQNQHHTHSPGNYLLGDQWVVQRAGGPNAFQITPGTGSTISTYAGSSTELDDGTGHGGLHQHTFAGNTGNVGSGTALDITPSWVAFNFMLRVY